MTCCVPKFMPIGPKNKDRPNDVESNDRIVDPISQGCLFPIHRGMNPIVILGMQIEKLIGAQVQQPRGRQYPNPFGSQPSHRIR